MMLLGPVAAMRGVATHRHAGAEGVKPSPGRGSSWLGERQLVRPSPPASVCGASAGDAAPVCHPTVATLHSTARPPARGRLQGPGHPPWARLNADERCRCQAGCPGSPLAEVSGGSWERKNWQLGRMSLHFPSSCSRLNDVPYLAFLTDRRNLMAETVTA